MTRPISPSAVVTALIAAAFCAGCGMPNDSNSPLTLGESNALRHSGSWMAPDAGKKSLLYVSDYQNDAVYVFSFPAGELTGTLSGFAGPFGECTDTAGNVFIANARPPEVLEYAHGGTSPIATIKDPGQYPYACSVNPTTGNLAVTNEYSREFIAWERRYL